MRGDRQLTVVQQLEAFDALTDEEKYAFLAQETALRPLFHNRWVETDGQQAVDEKVVEVETVYGEQIREVTVELTKDGAKPSDKLDELRELVRDQRKGEGGKRP